MPLRRKLIIAVALAAIASAPARADVKAGVEAWQRSDFAGAVKEWRPLADKGDADAQFNMGQAYKLGRGVPKDLRIAQSWYEKAAAQGHAQAQSNLGLILFQTGDRGKAMPWLKLASDKGDARAQYVYGTALFNGDLVAKDWPRAYALMSRAAASGLPPAGDSLKQMDQYMPAAERQKGIALSRQMQAGAAPARTSVPAAPVKTAAVRTAAPAKAPAPTAKPATTPPAPSGKWRVQLGAFGSTQIAQNQWSALSRKIAPLSGLKPSYEKAGALTRLRAGPLADRAAADRLCASAKAAGQACFTVAP